MSTPDEFEFANAFNIKFLVGDDGVITSISKGPGAPVWSTLSESPLGTVNFGGSGASFDIENKGLFRIEFTLNPSEDATLEFGSSPTIGADGGGNCTPDQVRALLNHNRSVVLGTGIVVQLSNQGECSNGAFGGFPGALIEMKSACTDSGNSCISTSTTGNSGSFTIPCNYAPGVGCDKEYVHVSKSGTPNSSAITASDVTAIQDHLLGDDCFDENWQLMAADVNQDDEISADDVTDIQAFLVSSTSFSPVWEFVDQAGYSNTISGTACDNDDVPADNPCLDVTSTLSFYAIRMGDVNGGNFSCFKSDNETRMAINEDVGPVWSSYVVDKSNGLSTIVLRFNNMAGLTSVDGIIKVPSNMNIVSYDGGEGNISTTRMLKSNELRCFTTRGLSSDKQKSFLEVKLSVEGNIDLENEIMEFSGYAWDYEKHLIKNSIQEDFRLFKNGQNKLSLFSKNAIDGVASVELFNLTGQKIHTQAIQILEGSNLINMSSNNLTSGLILCTISYQGRPFTIKYMNF